MHYIVAGATSNTGNAVIQLLSQNVGPENITCLVRPTSNIELLHELGLRLHVGDVTEPDSLKSVLSAGTVYLDMTHPKYYHRSLDAVVSAGVERAYFVTTTGVFSRYNQFSEIYKVNEERIRTSGVVYTLLRPTMIYGTLRDKNMNRLIRFLSRYPVLPLFGRGASLMQPVFVDDLATGIVSALGDRCSENQAYNLGGPEGISFRQIADMILSKLDRKVFKLNINMRVAAQLVRWAQRIPGFPITEEQVLRLSEDKVFDISKAVAELNYHPRSFDDGIAVEIAAMRAAGVLNPRVVSGNGR